MKTELAYGIGRLTHKGDKMIIQPVATLPLNVIEAYDVLDDNGTLDDELTLVMIQPDELKDKIIAVVKS